MKILKYSLLSICSICLLLLLSCSSNSTARNDSTTKTSSIQSKIILQDISQSSSEPANNSVNESSIDPSYRQQEMAEDESSEQDDEDIVQTQIDLRKLADHKYIAITFDDGPVPGNEERLLELFSQYNGHATFSIMDIESKTILIS